MNIISSFEIIKLFVRDLLWRLELSISSKIGCCKSQNWTKWNNYRLWGDYKLLIDFSKVERKRLTTGCLIFYPDLWDNASMKTYSFCSYSFYSFCSNYGLERKYGSGFSGKTTNSYRTMEKKYNWVPGQRYECQKLV